MARKLVSATWAWALVFLVIGATISPIIAASMDQDSRKFLAKPNDIKKQRQQPHLFGGQATKEKQTPAKQEGGFQWGNLLGMAVKLLVGGPTDGSANDKMDTITQLTTGEFSWTKMLSLGVQLVLSVLGGNDNAAIDKMDGGSPIEGILTAIISYVTGSNNPTEVTVMAKQASEMINLVVSLLDALRTSFTQRSMQARYMATYDVSADVGVAITTMAKGYVRTYQTDDDICMQKYLCDANQECVRGTGDSGYLLCQLGTYGLSYAMERTTYTPFEIYNDAGRVGRVMGNCSETFRECNEI